MDVHSGAHKFSELRPFTFATLGNHSLQADIEYFAKDLDSMVIGLQSRLSRNKPVLQHLQHIRLTTRRCITLAKLQTLVRWGREAWMRARGLRI